MSGSPPERCRRCSREARLRRRRTVGSTHARRMRLSRLLPAITAAVLCGAAPASASVTTYGYVPMPDGVQLHYMLVRPAESGRFPTIMTYDDYGAGSNGNAVLASAAASNPPDGSIGTDFIDHGYAYLGVNLRGTGCSTGVGNIGDVTTWGRDGANVMEWIARQSWSDGRVGMTGGSFQAMTQLGTAGFEPPQLKAIAPLSPTTDFYRDIDYPGGIPNRWTVEYPGAAQPGLTAPALVDAAQNRQTDCGAISPQSAPGNAIPNAPFAGAAALQHPYYDAFWANNIAARVPRIRIPVFGCLTWQDDAVSSRATSMYLTQLPHATTWFEGNNGGHVECTIAKGLLLKFFDHYVKGIDNGFQQTPHVMLGAEASVPTPRWLSYLEDWQAAVKPLRFYLHGHGVMDLTTPTGDDAADSYSYPSPSPSVPTWSTAGVSPGTSVAYTTPALADDAMFFGPGSVDFWLSSSRATDTDVQATISEVRPDGQEMYVGRGWLRMSHRRLDESQSTALRPVHTDLAPDALPLDQGQATFARLQLWPFNHVIRKGSRLRITFDTPATVQAGSSGFIPLTTPTENSVLHDRLHVSSVVLPLIPGFRAQAKLADCSAVSQQPCRAAQGARPQGSLAIPVPASVPRNCGSRRVTRLHLRGVRHLRIRSVTVRVNGRPFAIHRRDRRGRALTLRFGGFPKGTVHVRITIRARRPRSRHKRT